MQSGDVPGLSRREALWSAVAAATAFLVLAVARLPYEEKPEGGSCCYRTPKWVSPAALHCLLVFGIIAPSIPLRPRELREVAMRFRLTLTILTLAMTLVVGPCAPAQPKNVGPSSAGPRPNAVRPYVACAAAVPALPPRAQQKPFTREQVSNMVRDGFGDDSGAKLIEQRGIDFAPSEDFIQTLKTAGGAYIGVHVCDPSVALRSRKVTQT
jgi:hypothetical protein